MSNHCETIQPLIIDYALRELDSREAKLVEEHLRTCPACSEEAREARRIVSALSEQEMLEPSAALCDSLRQAVRENALGRGRPFSSVTALANSFVRRPLLVGASAMVVIGAVALLIISSGLHAPNGERPSPFLRRDASTLLKFKNYLLESEELMKLIQGERAAELLASRDWKQWVGQAMTMAETEGFEAYQPLFGDMKTLYDEIEACKGIFGEGQILRIRGFISNKNLVVRIEGALGSAK